MSDERGVGVNGEPDDFGARYDRLALGGGGTGWVLKTLFGIAMVLVVASVVWSLLPV